MRGRQRLRPWSNLTSAPSELRIAFRNVSCKVKPIHSLLDSLQTFAHSMFHSRASVMTSSTFKFEPLLVITIFNQTSDLTVSWSAAPEEVLKRSQRNVDFRP
ncbi:Uncharacterized protein Y057_5697 [Fusarium fujikuroi]|nr:Uncharacterized protein LW93_10218 [Fusarium fujikuroi]KLP04923.1 Uncharacterized protein Y057_5697 [Fusarium fujikuroi]